MLALSQWTALEFISVHCRGCQWFFDAGATEMLYPDVVARVSLRRGVLRHRSRHGSEPPYSTSMTLEPRRIRSAGAGRSWWRCSNTKA